MYICCNDLIECNFDIQVQITLQTFGFNICVSMEMIVSRFPGNIVKI